MTTILDFLLYTAHDVLICITLVFASVYLLGGKFKKNIPAALGVGAIIAANAVFCIFFFKGTEEDKQLILDVVSSICYALSVLWLAKDVKKGTRLWFLLLCVCTMEMFYSLFAPYIPEYLFARAIVYIIMYALMLFFIIFTQKQSSNNIMPQVFDSVPRPIFAAVLFFDMTGYYKSFGESYAWYNVLYIISTISVILCVLFFVFRIFSLTYQQNEILRQFNDQKNFSEKMLKGDENLRQFRHDYRNHMIVINALLESGSTDRAREYINAMNADISGTLNKISTGNFIADTILNTKAVVAAQSDNKIVFSGQFPSEGIEDKDICTILGNTIDNAIEATERLSGCTIRVESAVRNNNLILSVSNPVEKDVKIGKNNTLKTTKKNRAEHGIGTKNVNKTIKKYNGDLIYDCQNLTFTADIRLKLPTKEKAGQS